MGMGDVTILVVISGSEATIAAMTVRTIPDGVHTALKRRAKEQGRSVEAQTLAILEEAPRGEDRDACRLDRNLRLIVVDTNVISESIRFGGSPRVQTRLDSHLAETLFVTATTSAELLAGLSTMPTDRRRRDLETKLELLFARLFPGSLIPFDEQAGRR